MNPDQNSCLHAIIEGHVQGVGFRAFVYDHAQSIGLAGWVRNKGDEQVEVWAEGPSTDLERLLALLRQGPRMSRVTAVDVDYPTPEGKFTHFMVVSSTY
jgi:acylphosphatase